MKKIFGRIAVIVFSAAGLLVSCGKEMMDSPASGRDASIQIAPPADSDTKVQTTDNGTKVSIVGWSLGDKVTMLKVIDTQTFKSAEFTCTNAASGIFSGTLPEGVASAAEFSIAVFNGCDFRVSGSDIVYRPLNLISTDLKTSVLMAAKKDGTGAYKMKVVNNILKISNNKGSSINAAIKASAGAMCVFTIPYFITDSSLQYSPGASNAGSFADASFTIPVGASYLVMPSSENEFKNHSFGLCLSADGQSAASLVPFKKISSIGKIFTVTLEGE